MRNIYLYQVFYLESRAAVVYTTQKILLKLNSKLHELYTKRYLKILRH